MHIKPTCRSCAVASGSTESPSNPTKFPVTSEFTVLGHILQTNGSIRACWKQTRCAMWRAFWSNSGSKDADNFNVEAKLNLLSRSVMPQMDFRSSRWPPQKQIATEIDRTQRKMTAAIVTIPHNEYESSCEFVRRRGRAAAKLCNEHGLWSKRWFGRASRWDDHLNQYRNHLSWPAKLRQFKDRTWFIFQRSQFTPVSTGPFSNFSATAGRTDTRAVRGYVHMRWHDGIIYSRSVCS